MWRQPHRINFNGRTVTLKALSDAFGVPYDTCLKRYKRGYTDPWEILYGPGGTPRTLYISEEQKKWLRETARCRRGQIRAKGKNEHTDAEWDIACDLIGVPRAFSKELREVMEA